jgi:hypothetical protein
MGANRSLVPCTRVYPDILRGLWRSIFPISGSTEWINLKFAGFIEYILKLMRAKNCSDTLQDAEIRTALVKISPKMGQKRKKELTLKTV